jgi:NAD(P)-dependent dehydrogenase (short-subunit alcohol dehydrogenase family)
MDLELNGKVALVTGASKGIGRAIATALAREGMQVAVAARNAAELDALTAQLGEGAMAFPCDLTETGAPAAFAAAALARYGRIDLVVNNAGSTVRGDFLTLTEADWQAGFALKFHGYRRMAAATWLELKQRSGTLINIIGVGARMGNGESTIVGAVNAALVNLTKALADKGVSDGVRVLAIMPGYIATDRWSARVAREAAASGVTLVQAEQRMVKAAGIARVGQPAEIGQLVALLASPAASYVQGAIIDADGGLTRAL